MKIKDIEIGKTYTDGKGNVRRILDIGPQYANVGGGQVDKDCVSYRVEKRSSGPVQEGCCYTCTRRAFASWAKSILNNE